MSTGFRKASSFGGNIKPEHLTAPDGAVGIKKPSAGAKPVATPLPINTLVDKAYPSTPKTFSADPQLQAKFKLLDSALNAESQKPDVGYAKIMLELYKKLGDEPDNITMLSNDALALFFRAATKLYDDPTGSKALKKAGDAQARQIMMDMEAGAGDVDALDLL